MDRLLLLIFAFPKCMHLSDSAKHYAIQRFLCSYYMDRIWQSQRFQGIQTGCPHVCRFTQPCNNNSLSCLICFRSPATTSVMLD